jgi:glycosyltransferase involved in cell wall biosynthesis
MAEPDVAPRDIVICCCRDEEDIIAEFISFYLDMGFDRVCLIDNGSRDATAARIREHPGRDRVLYWHDPRPGYDTRLLEYYRRFEAEADRWVFFLDADELVAFPRGFKEYAAALPPEVTVLELPMSDMLPLPAGETGHPFLSARRSRAVYGQIKVTWKRVQVDRIYCGKHKVDLHPYRGHSERRIFVRHYHTRSAGQLRKKLENRVELGSSLPLQEIERLSVFSAAETRSYFEESRRLLEEDRVEEELDSARREPWVPDNTIRNWFLGRAGAAGAPAE